MCNVQYLMRSDQQFTVYAQTDNNLWIYRKDHIVFLFEGMQLRKVTDILRTVHSTVDANAYYFLSALEGYIDKSVENLL